MSRSGEAIPRISTVRCKQSIEEESSNKTRKKEGKNKKKWRGLAAAWNLNCRAHRFEFLAHT
jgi:hypothetical protein